MILRDFSLVLLKILYKKVETNYILIAVLNFHFYDSYVDNIILLDINDGLFVS